MKIRNYNNSDYDAIAELYKNSELYGGQFDENRDSEEKLQNSVTHDPESILVCESENKIVGTVSLIENGRIAWLFRFAALADESETDVLKQLFMKASDILKSREHNQILVYSPINNKKLSSRYLDILNFEKGTDYTCFWKNI